MSEFVSWIEYGGNNYFLKNNDLDTKEGREVYPIIKDDICGHGAIREYYIELKKIGKKKECVDFSTPANFPKEIVKAIKQGQMSRIGICLDILNEKGKKEYQKIQQPAWAAKYLKIQQPAYAEYLKIQQPAYDKYLKIKQLAYDKYLKIKQPAFSKIVSQKKYRVKNWK